MSFRSSDSDPGEFRGNANHGSKRRSRGRKPRNNDNKPNSAPASLQEQGEKTAHCNPYQHQQLAVKTRGVMFAGVEPIPTDSRVDPPAYSCLNCWGYGHDWKQCPEPRVAARYCKNCGRRGVELTSCPRCGRAHREYLVEKYRLSREEADEIAATAGGGGAAGAGMEVEMNGTRDAPELLELSMVVWDGDREEKSPRKRRDADGESTSDFVEDIARLMESMKGLSVETKDLVVRQVVMERREMMMLDSKTSYRD